MKTYYTSCSQFPSLAIRFGRVPLASWVCSIFETLWTGRSMSQVKIRGTALAEWYTLCPFCKRPDLERVARLANYLCGGGPEPPEQPCRLCQSGDILI